MKEIYLASKNIHKISEFQNMLGPQGFVVKAFNDIFTNIDIVENGQSFAENALIKVRTMHKLVNKACISDDSGICVEALGGGPGINSARYLGENTDYSIKNQSIIDACSQSEQWNAKYICVIGYIDDDGNEYTFEGQVEGMISRTACGCGGFGYDPIFFYPPLNLCLAQLTQSEKDSISHRHDALVKLLAFLEKEKKGC